MIRAFQATLFVGLLGLALLGPEVSASAQQPTAEAPQEATEEPERQRPSEAQVVADFVVDGPLVPRAIR